MEGQTYDVVIIGGGSAGSAAAVAAARHGRHVLLVERSGFLGGTGTSVLDSFYGFFTPGERPKRVVGGIAWEVVRNLDAEGAMLLRPSTYGAGGAVTYNPEILKVVWERLVVGSGATVLLHALCTGISAAGDLWRIEVATRTEHRTIEAQWLIDASGDAQPAVWAGASAEMLDRARLQSLTTTFRLVNVDAERARTVDHATLVGLMEDAAQNGYDLPRRDGSIHVTPIRGSYVANMTRVSDVNPLVPEELSRAEIAGREQALEYVRFLQDRVPGYRNSQLSWLSTHLGVRESRRIVGEHTLTRDEVIGAATFPDGIALCGAPIEEHHAGSGTRWEYLPPGESVDIPLRCLVPRVVERLLVAGRCLSATHDAHAAVRSMGQCMAMGQAAGTAVAQALDDDTDARGLDTDRLRAVLERDGVILRNQDADTLAFATESQ